MAHGCPLRLVAVLTLLIAASPAAADTSLRAQAGAVFSPISPPPPAGDDETLARVRLGRLLFFEPRVSSDGAVSCARCHQPAMYGTDGLPRSIGAEHRLHPRHSQTVLNTSLQFVQHWRGDRTSVEDQAVKALTAPPAYGNPDFATAMAKLRAIPGYTPLFAGAFPGQGEPITPENWGRAIGAYVRTLLTPAPFDRFLEGDDAALSPVARTGLRAFMSLGCAACHAGPALGGGMYQRFGIVEEYWKATGSTTVDRGRFDVTQDPRDLHVFKVPGLRNVAMTPPYFHDGSVATLPEAVRVMARVQLGRSLAQAELEALVAFLASLTGDLPAHFAAAPTLPSAASLTGP